MTAAAAIEKTVIAVVVDRTKVIAAVFVITGDLARVVDAHGSGAVGLGVVDN
jgi:hypothetical protein